VPAGAAAATPNAAELIKGNMTMPERVGRGRQGVRAGWPLLVLAGLGVWSLVRRRTRDRLTSALIAWGIVWLGLSAYTALAPVNPANVRYVAEFIGRINLATIPLLVILAASAAIAGAGNCRAARRPLQVGAAFLCIAAFALAAGMVGWFRDRDGVRSSEFAPDLRTWTLTRSLCR
jgi:hypothetical protein